MLLLLALLCAQEDQTVFRTEKTEYLAAEKDCRAAEAILTSDPRAAIALLDPILANPKLKKIECRIRIENRPAEYSERYNFLPYQFRARARMALAAKSDPEAAQKLLDGAVADLEESARRKVASSEELLKTAKTELAKLKAAAADPSPANPVKESPLVKVRASIAPLLQTSKFKSAKAKIALEGKDLPPEERKVLEDDVDRRCLDSLSDSLFQFRRRFLRLEEPRDLAGISDSAIDLLFSLPDPSELSVSLPALDWARSALPAFKDVQSGKAGLEALLPSAAAAAKIENGSDDSFFVVVEKLAYAGMSASVKDLVSKAQDQPKAEREKLKAQADGLAARWKAFADGLDPAFRTAHRAVADHGAELAREAGGFPADLAELAKVDVDAVFASASPDTELKRLEDVLRLLATKSNATIESRRTLYTSLVAVAALRALLEGKDEAAAATSLQPLAASLAAAGGPSDPKRWGPRVEQVFAQLR
jgi:hypothetical protein